MTTIVGSGTELRCQWCGTLLIAKDGIYTCPKCRENPNDVKASRVVDRVLCERPADGDPVDGRISRSADNA